jgi:RNA polymerase sigma factor (sigma-70 family)
MDATLGFIQDRSPPNRLRCRIVVRPHFPSMPSPDSRTLATALVQQAVRDHESALVGYISSITHDHEAARDVVQDTFLKLYTRDDPAALDGPGLKPWLFTVARNRALDWLRKHRRMIPMENAPLEALVAAEAAPVEEHRMADTDEATRIMRFFRRLPPNQAECLRLKFQNDLSYKEIATATGLSVTNVGFLIHTGLKRLRHLLELPPTGLSTLDRPTLTPMPQ